ncbi:YlaH-like family protein [Salicibibacter cibi]|uniref:YlaH-like family protein n=1 Tax=Salicibibacter cibi TaxID=2743001 RepID=A0A7T6ZET0_9BACI|nr:YlaH-like family protein [Salicibibacter cibi]QQK81972.1 YlaH-like family protein [Salicibibacter cibi]
MFGIYDNMALGFWLLYIAVVALCVIVFNLGFARKLPLLKNVVVYAGLIIGCFVLTFFAIFMPVAEALIVIAAVLGVYRIRLRIHRKKQQEA